jgi:N-sulfoglucosamine sulfohydrolase
LIKQMWNGGAKPPVTAEPLFVRSNNVVAIKCITDGASIAYKLVGNDGVVPQRWEVYTKPIELEKDQKLMAVAQRIGYVSSKIVE